ncbi:MAG: D-alanyl-D-alanine carboxypeptidase [Alicyclobacillus herbarius]|uniref:D-alanyl-D-alanine carboxypeptidase family protein n=1 Tax=Alicyclobacillus herbarius TaxID=122960 RepID=UPI0003F8C4D1|nr:D-alanyl-D-alanine carboxypeptidase family protein [Alicyclobacillus herbarius]MCL6630991.1 D-alanyl-D-alanine carboxypeptidase [Alicyclobacillus herbarius]
MNPSRSPVWRRWLSFLTACLTVVSLFTIHASAREGGPSRVYVNARAAVVLDADSGRILYAKNADEPFYPASTTKLMTAILLVEYLHMHDPVYISETAARQERVRLGLKPDTYITAEQALNALIMKSANDVAYAVAETIGGSQLGFARMMNVKARLLGCTHTNFVTPNGLHDDGHRSSAHDIALILREAVRHPEIVQAMQTKQYTIEDKTIRNGNRFIYLTDSPFGEIVGGKTGYTSKAMYCLAFAVRQHGRLRISVVLGAPRKSLMYRETQRLLQFAAENRDVELV